MRCTIGTVQMVRFCTTLVQFHRRKCSPMADVMSCARASWVLRRIFSVFVLDGVARETKIHQLPSLEFSWWALGGVSMRARAQRPMATNGNAAAVPGEVPSGLMESTEQVQVLMRLAQLAGLKDG